MYQSHLRVPHSPVGAAGDGTRRSVNSVSVFISPNLRSQNHAYQKQITAEDSRETSFDEIENLRAEVKRLSDIVSEQSDLISLLQKKICKKSSEDNTVAKLDLLTELNQHKITLACLERDNLAVESRIQQLQTDVVSLSATVGQQCNELLLLRNAMRDLFLGMVQTPPERNSASPQLRSVSCSELQANCVSYGAPKGPDSCRRVVRSYTSRLPPSGHLYHPRENGETLRQHSSPLKAGSSGKLSSWVLFLKSPKISLRQASSTRTQKFRTNGCPLVEDDFSSAENVGANHKTRPPSLLLPTSTNFEDWSPEAVCDFLHLLGLGYCKTAARRWIKTGADIINASNAQLQQNLGPLRPLHLKKLLIHVSLRTTHDLMATRETAFLPGISPHPNFSISVLMLFISFCDDSACVVASAVKQVPPKHRLRLAWLEAIGLPMYTSTFEAELVDAYVLHELTLSELQTLGVNVELHMLSMRRGLQLMRRLNFDLSRLCRGAANAAASTAGPVYRRRRSNGGTSDDAAQMSPEIPAIMMESAHSTPTLRTTQSPTLKSPATIHRSTSVSADTICRDATPSENSTPLSPSSSFSSSLSPSSASPSLWTFRRLQAWLREIELPEYVSSVRGSGLHGALLVYEERFTVETLAALLDIGPERTLLRRHLSEQFTNLLGPAICERKRRLTAENAQNAPPLNPFTKLKLIDRRPSIRKIFDVSGSGNSGAVRYLGSDLLCPLEADLDFKTSSGEDAIQS